MQYVIRTVKGTLLSGFGAKAPVLFPTREEAYRWLKKGDRIEPWTGQRDDKPEE